MVCVYIYCFTLINFHVLQLVQAGSGTSDFNGFEAWKTTSSGKRFGCKVTKMGCVQYFLETKTEKQIPLDLASQYIPTWILKKLPFRDCRRARIEYTESDQAECIGPRGFSGTKGLPGVKGNIGSFGSDGRKGDNGVDGKDGKIGESGSDGEQGRPGKKGTSGVAGQSGTAGHSGQPGRDGRDGLLGTINMSEHFFSRINDRRNGTGTSHLNYNKCDQFDLVALNVDDKEERSEKELAQTNVNVFVCNGANVNISLHAQSGVVMTESVNSPEERRYRLFPIG